MPSIPVLDWSKQKKNPYDTSDQLVGCALCPLDAVPPATLYFFNGTSACAEHIEELRNPAKPIYPEEKRTDWNV